MEDKIKGKDLEEKMRKSFFAKIIFAVLISINILMLTASGFVRFFFTDKKYYEKFADETGFYTTLGDFIEEKVKQEIPDEDIVKVIRDEVFYDEMLEHQLDSMLDTVMKDLQTDSREVPEIDRDVYKQGIHNAVNDSITDEKLQKMAEKAGIHITKEDAAGFRNNKLVQGILNKVMEAADKAVDAAVDNVQKSLSLDKLINSDKFGKLAHYTSLLYNSFYVLSGALIVLITLALIFAGIDSIGAASAAAGALITGGIFLTKAKVLSQCQALLKSASVEWAENFVTDGVGDILTKFIFTGAVLLVLGIVFLFAGSLFKRPKKAAE